MNETVIIHTDECKNLLLCDESCKSEIIEVAKQGLRGPKGDAGPQGPQGIPGPPGSGVVYQAGPPASGSNLLWVRTADGSIFHEESGKWVSEPRTFPFWQNRSSNALLSFGGKSLRIPFTGRLSGISIEASGNITKSFNVLKNGVSVFAFSLSSGVFDDLSLAIDLAENDIIQIRSGTGTPAFNIQGFIYIREVVV